MKLNKITDLRDVICYWEHCAEERSKSPVTLIGLEVFVISIVISENILDVSKVAPARILINEDVNAPVIPKSSR